MDHITDFSTATLPPESFAYAMPHNRKVNATAKAMAKWIASRRTISYMTSPKRGVSPGSSSTAAVGGEAGKGLGRACD